MQEELDKIKDIDPWGLLDVYLGSELAIALKMAWDKQHPKVSIYEYYHTRDHMLGVAKIALYIADKEGIQHKPILTKLTLAALFHDFHHTLGTHSDFVNIQRAEINVEALFNKLGIGSLIEPVNKLIASTLYVPGSSIIMADNLDFSLKPLGYILHDADYLWATMTQDPETILTGLRNEINNSQGRYVSRYEMLAGQMEFQKNVVMTTKTGQSLWDKYQPKFFKNIEKSVTSNLA